MREYKIQGIVKLTCDCGFEVEVDIDDWVPLEDLRDYAEEKAEDIHYWTEEDCPACRVTPDVAECEKADQRRCMENNL